MNTYSLTMRSLAVLSLAVVTACGGSTEKATTTVGELGGTVALKTGLTLAVPAGALPQAVVVTITETRHGEDTDIELEPHGLELSSPATLGLDDDGTGELEHESGEHLQGDHHGGRLEGQINRFEHLRVRHHRGADGGVDDHGGHGEADGGHGDGGVDDHGGADGGHDADGGSGHDADGGSGHGQG